MRGVLPRLHSRIAFGETLLKFCTCLRVKTFSISSHDFNDVRLPSGSVAVMAPKASGSQLPSTAEPSPSRSLRGQQILEEESYVSSLSSLIQREFFPNLPRLTAENDYLSALEDFDNGVEGAEGRMRDAEWRLDALDEEERTAGGQRRGRTRAARSRSRMAASSVRSATPSTSGMTASPSVSRHGWGDATPTPRRHSQWSATPNVRTPRDQRDGSVYDEHDEEAGPSGPSLSQHTLATFQKAYTSEDNASFLSLLQHTNDQRRERYAWAFNQEREHNERRKAILDEASKRADEGYARSFMALPEGKRRKLITGGKMQDSISNRVQELQKLYAWEEGRRRRSSQGLVTNGADDKSHRLFRAGSEERTSATDSADPSSSRHASLFVNRPRSASPPPPSGLQQLKHSLDPKSEVGRSRSAASAAAGTKWSARNALFYGPDADIGTTDKATSSLPDPLNATSTAKTSFRNTALPSQGVFPESRYPAPYSSKSTTMRQRASSCAASSSAGTARSSRIASALAGGSQYGENFNDEDGRDMRYKGPTVNGYGFVTPQREGEGEEEMRALLRQKATHPSSKERLAAQARGTAGAPRATASSSTPSSSRGFAIPETPHRDELAHSLASKSSKSKASSSSLASASTSSSASRPSLRQSLGLAQSSPSIHRTPTSKRSEHLSPAAKTLLNRSVRGGPVSIASPVAAQRQTSSKDTMAKLRRRGWDEA